MDKRIKDNNSYSSPAMIERRKRILKETRILLSEQGVSGFSLMDLCKRADVAKQTLYYGFGSKESLIAGAILDYFEEHEQNIIYHSDICSLERLVERTVTIGHRNLGVKHYVAAIIQFYYNPQFSSELWSDLRDIMIIPQRSYILHLQEQGQLKPWANAEQLIDALLRERMSIANAWIQGRISDENMIDSMVISQLTYLAGSVAEPTRNDVEKVLLTITSGGYDAYFSSLSGN